MPPLTRVAIDANCVTYLVEALEAIREPTDALAPQRKALTWLLFRGNPALCTVPANEDEVAAIKDRAKKQQHLSWLSVAFPTCVSLDSDAIAAQTCAYLTAHNELKDCRAVAEASSAGCVAYLTNDARLISHLVAYARPLKICRPSEYWANLAVPKGFPPKWAPDALSPLAEQPWIRW